MASDEDADVPETGALFTYGLTFPEEYVPSKFWLKNDVIIDFACGDEHSIFITKNGKAYSCGKNDWGQLGLGHTDKINMPTLIKYFKSQKEKILLVSCGRLHSLFYTDKLRIYGCGSNSEHQILPHGETFLTPVLIESWKSTPVKQLSCGVDMSALLTKSGEIYVWGSNDAGQLGLGEDETVDEPTKLDIRGQWGSPPVWINCGAYHCGASLQDGRLLVWGESEFGKLGLGDVSEDYIFTPQIVQIEEITEVHCGLYHTLAIAKSGHVYAWGNGKSGQLGLGRQCMQSSSPMKIEGLEGISIVNAAVGDEHSLVISDCGLLYSFGDGQYGKLGASEVEGFVNVIRPSNVPRFSNFNVKMVSCGHHHTLIYAQPLTDKDRKKRQLNGHLEDDSMNNSLRSSLTLFSSMPLRRKRNRNSRALGLDNNNLPTLVDRSKRSSRPPSSSGDRTTVNGENSLLRTAPILRKPSDLASPRSRNKIIQEFCEKFDLSIRDDSRTSYSLFGVKSDRSFADTNNKENKRHSDIIKQIYDTNLTLRDEKTISDNLTRCYSSKDDFLKVFEKSSSNNGPVILRKGELTALNISDNFLLTLLSMLSEEEIMYALNSSIHETQQNRCHTPVKKKLYELYSEAIMVDAAVTKLMLNILEMFEVYEQYLVIDLCAPVENDTPSLSSVRGNRRRRSLFEKLKATKCTDKTCGGIFDKSLKEYHKNCFKTRTGSIKVKFINSQKFNNRLNSKRIQRSGNSLTVTEIDSTLNDEPQLQVNHKPTSKTKDASILSTLNNYSTMWSEDNLNDKPAKIASNLETSESCKSIQKHSTFTQSDKMESVKVKIPPIVSDEKSKTDYQNEQKCESNLENDITVVESSSSKSFSCYRKDFKTNLPSSKQYHKNEETVKNSFTYFSDEKTFFDDASLSQTIDSTHNNKTSDNETKRKYDKTPLPSLNIDSIQTRSGRNLSFYNAFHYSENFKHFLKSILTDTKKVADIISPQFHLSSKMSSSIVQSNIDHFPGLNNKPNRSVFIDENESLVFVKDFSKLSQSANGKIDKMLRKENYLIDCHSCGDFIPIKTSNNKERGSNYPDRSSCFRSNKNQSTLVYNNPVNTNSELKSIILNKLKLNLNFGRVYTFINAKSERIVISNNSSQKLPANLGTSSPKKFRKLKKIFVCC